MKHKNSAILPARQRLGGLPRVFRQARVLVIGPGDVGLRLIRQLSTRVRVTAVIRRMEAVSGVRAAGARPLAADLDRFGSLRRLRGIAPRIAHLAPPPQSGSADTRTQALLRALGPATPGQTLVYVSTSGVYGDCQGALVDETWPLRPLTARARRRVDAEQRLRAWSARTGFRLRLLRAPGIYAADRAQEGPRQRLLRQVPVLCPQEDVYTNHIQADDLARAIALALFRGPAPRVFNICDHSHWKVGEYMDVAAAVYGLPSPPRVSWAEAATQLPAAVLSFWAESRRLLNARALRELRWRPRWENPAQGLRGPNGPGGLKPQPGLSGRSVGPGSRPKSP